MNATRRPGQPLAAMLGLLAVWTIARIAFWEPPFAIAASRVGDVLATETQRYAPAVRSSLRLSDDVETAGAAPRIGLFPQIAARTPTPVDGRASSITPGDPQGAARLRRALLPPVLQGARIYPRSVETPDPRSPRADPPQDFAGPSDRARIGGDAWLVWRPGSDPGNDRLVSRYGASQAGAIARFSLADSGHRPAIYARTTAAIDPVASRELAVGVSGRPLASVPLRLQLEMRAREADGSMELAPAALAVTELNPRRLPLGLVARTYFAAGYVAGRYRTPFVDGSLRVDRPVGRLGRNEVRFGAGAWGGAQEGAAALDVGPGLSVQTSLAGQQIELGIDYRLRIAGNAEPRSGAALTVSTGF